MKNINICIIGGGSKQWALTLMKDLSLASDLSGLIRLYDIDQEAAILNEHLGNRIFLFGKDKPNFEVKAIDNPEKALAGADFVIISIEPGPIENRHTDLEIPKKYGILQTVGDTIGPGGIFRALRSIPVFREYARLIKKNCPDAWVINYTNPMTWCTNTLTREFPQVKVLGCCHEVFGTQKFIANKVSSWFDTETPPREEIKVDVFGVNHFTFLSGASWKGIDLFPYLKELAGDDNFYLDHTKESLRRIKEEKWFESDNLVAMEIMRIFGNLGAAGDRHLVEFMPWYLHDESFIHRYGVIATPYEWRVRRDKEKRTRFYEDKDLFPKASEEEGVAIIKALLGLGPLYTNVNVPNTGQIPWLPFGHIVETNAFITHNRITPAISSEGASSVKELISHVGFEQKLLLDSVFEENREGIFQAFLLDSLIRLSLSEARELFDIMWREQMLHY